MTGSSAFLFLEGRIMKKRASKSTIVVLFLVLIPLFFPAISLAEDQSVFGPKDFRIGWMHFNLSVHSFSVDAGGEGLILVTKATPDKKIEGGFLLLNAQLIGLDDFLEGKNETTETGVSLRPTNFLTVFLRGTPGATISITVKKGSATPPPEVTFQAVPHAISLGATSTLQWTTTCADLITIDQGIGDVVSSGSLQVAPERTTTYTITVNGPGGSATASVTIDVEDQFAQTTVTIGTSPSTIPKGSTSILSWVSKNAESIHIDNGIGTVPVEGILEVSPEHTTTYTITAIGANGAASAQTTLFVLGNPLRLPEISFGSQYEDMIPPDATIESYDPKRFALVTGLVSNAEEEPIEGVSITFLTNPEYGTTFSDDTGRFSIAVEGGGNFTLQYRKEGFITAQRQVNVPWNDIAIVETISMVAEDSRSTHVVLNGDQNVIITHRSTTVEDSRGTRSCTLIFRGDNKAYVVDEKGNSLQELASLTVRATEFKTPESMPAVLPPNSGFTYCAELKADNVDRIRFRDPVTVLIDNFLNFPVGMRVPVGYYDRDRGLWVPIDNGVVVRLLAYYNTEGIADSIDTNEDGIPEERVPGLSDKARFIPGSTYSYIKLNHFSPFDPNFPIITPPDAVDPNAIGVPYADQQRDNIKDCSSHTSSFVEERSRIFHEEIPIPGTPLSLHYSSNRVPGFKTVITVPVSGETVPASLKRIEAEVSVAGVQFHQVFDPLPNVVAQFVWDGRDYLGRMTMGPTKAQVTTIFVYEGIYAIPASTLRSFAQAGIDPTSVPTRRELVRSKSSEVTVGFERAAARGEIADGWSLSVHHSLSFPDLTTLTKGDGTTIRNNLAIIDTLAGNGVESHSGDGGSATEAGIAWPSDVTFDKAGNLYIVQYGLQAIRKVDSTGMITKIAGDGRNSCGWWGDDGLALMAGICARAATVDPRGDIYIADTFNHRVRKIDRDGIITTIAGDGIGGYSGDGRPAIEARIYYPYDIVADDWGNLYICTADHRIRKIDPDGIITTAAGTGIAGYSGDGGPATLAQIYSPNGLAVDKLENLYIADLGNMRVRKVDSTGVITTVAGNGIHGYSGDGIPAVEAQISGAAGVAVDNSGNLYIAERAGNRVRKVDTRGIITTVAGNGVAGYSGDGGSPYEASLNWPTAVTIDQCGNLIIADENNHRIRKIAPPSAYAEFVGAGEIAFLEEGGLAHIISSVGTHKSTVDLGTGANLYHFMYGQENLLSAIYNSRAPVAYIARDESGTPISIGSPDSVVTRLAIDANRHLTGVTLPDNSLYSFEYTPDGLMLAKEEPNGNRFEHQFDSAGRLINAADEEGGNWTFSRTVFENGECLSEVETAEGNLTSYLDYTESTGAYSSVIADPLGGETLFSQTGDGMRAEKCQACGMDLQFKYAIDPEYKYRFLKEVKERSPSGLERTKSLDKTYKDRDSNGIPDQITEVFSTNGKASSLVIDKSAYQKTMISPQGRTLTTFHDPASFQTTRMQIPGFYETTYGYDSRNRLTSITTNTRKTTIGYNAKGYIASITDGLNETTNYTYDPVGRVTNVLAPDGSSIYFSYDRNGNSTVVNTPTDVDHLFGYSKVNLNDYYTAPLSGTYQYFYDKDRRLIQVAFPSGDLIKNVYDNTRLAKIQTPEGDINFSYLCGFNVRSVNKGSEAIAYEYDGSLLTSETLTGTLNLSISYAYNNDFQLQRQGYAGAFTNYVYDNDGLLTSSGNLGIYRDSQNGLPLQISGGNFSLRRTFNGYGEVSSQAALVAGQEALSWTVERNTNGKIIGKTEETGGFGSADSYAYDSRGRLLTVVRDGKLIEEYQYGANGARIREMNTRRDISGRSFSYSAEDHLLSVDLAGSGTIYYEYDVDGFLTRRIEGLLETKYRYSSRGELLEVVLPNGGNFEYVHDPLRRRIAKKVNGTVVEKYLWQGRTRLLAVYDGSDNLLMRFEYADDRVPMAMTKAGAVYYLAYDQVGSLKVVADSAGNIVKRIDYDSFGNVLYDSSPGFTVPFGFAGGLHDRDTGLVRFGFRDYDPDIGRWTAKDPILFAGGDSDLYGYCLSDPVNCVDLLGLAKGDWWDPRTYVSFSLSYTVMAEGASWEIGGNDSKTFTPLTLVGGSLDINIGALPAPSDTIYEYGLGLGKHLGLGYFFGRPDSLGRFDIGGLAIHVGFGIGAPFNLTITSPETNRSFSNFAGKELYYDKACEN
jgi:RHS repeat-associated protein